MLYINIKNMYKRNCPECECELVYKLERCLKHAEKIKSCCRSCRNKGEKNPFFNKHHDEKSKKLMTETKKSHNLHHTEEYKENHRKRFSGEGNPMYGRKVYDIWLEKYGKEIADEKLVELKRKLSIKSSGKNNPMYGRSSPTGSGNGWSGWYSSRSHEDIQNVYFRSITELAFLVKVIERFKMNYVSGELKKYSIKYRDHNNTERTYHPDYIVNDKYMIECKPFKLQTSINNKLKKEAAEKFCKNNNLIYKFFDVKKFFSYNDIKILHDSGDIKFIDRYEEKFFNI
jgi:hypothetical protein